MKAPDCIRFKIAARFVNYFFLILRNTLISLSHAPFQGGAWTIIFILFILLLIFRDFFASNLYFGPNLVKISEYFRKKSTKKLCFGWRTCVNRSKNVER